MNTESQPHWVAVLLFAAACSEPADEHGATSTADDSSVGTAIGTGSATEQADAAATSADASSTGLDPAASTGDTNAATETTTGDASDDGVPAELPAEVLDLTDWKLTLPIEDPSEPDSPLEILQPELATYTIDPHFHVTARGDAVTFSANAGGATTDNSGYPRSELREMTESGSELASWSTSEGVHTMTITQAITHLPEAKPHVVAGQIHDAQDDVVMIRLEGEHLFVEGGGDELGELEPAYVLGDVFTVRLTATEGRIDVYYEDLATPAVTLDVDTDGCYFKAGAYTQSNEKTGDAPDAFGEVVIHELVVSHG